jgi:biotin carboxyl carrier protein
VDVDGEEYSLDLRRVRNGSEYEYALYDLGNAGAKDTEGTASILEIMPGVFSVLIGQRSLQISIARTGEELEVWAGGRRRRIVVADARDRSGKSKQARGAGPQEIRAQMPGKVISVLIGAGESVIAGQGVIIVEAMKMQNEMKSPKDGIVTKVFASEGATVGAGETLMIVE